MNKEQIKNAQADKTDLAQMQGRMLEVMKKIHAICEKHNLKYWLVYGSLLGAIRHEGFIPWDDDMDIMMPREDLNKFLSVAQDELGDDFFLQTPNTDKHYTILNIPFKVRDNHSTLIEEYDKDYHQGAFVDIFTMDYAGPDFEAFMKLHKRTSMLASLKMRIDFHQLSGIKRYLRILLQLIFKLVPLRTIFNHLQNKAKPLLNNNIHNSTMGVSGIEFVEKDLFPLDEVFPLQLHKYEDAQFYIPNNYDKLLRSYFGDYNWIPPEDQRVPHGIFYSLKRFYDIPNKK